MDAEVTNFGQIIGSVTEDGDTLQLLRVGGRLYVKPASSGLPGVTNQGNAAALKSK